ncbi:hypothetical protein EM20IM_03780 [Candidatus Methylacidiphilum infernorum]|uniref:Cytochrome c n=1 Tax=Candidatus Methylacidiphilum infernorum TaxID=511746 RepID=A0ABX7PXS0_9BACT|nr:cytochrome c [Candidatus Methylacidiphilum infernorum]QSR87453.1 hypothetical protein EM20IM_03780 [Candidatus Methylacidiphilum infernorum]
MRCLFRFILLMVVIDPRFSWSLSKEEELYWLHCSGCHGLKGEGVAGVSPRISETIGYFASTEKARKYIIKLPGVALSPISDEELADLLNWMVVSFSPQKFSFKKFTKEEIARQRTEPLWEIEKERLSLLKTLPQKEALSRSWKKFRLDPSP